MAPILGIWASSRPAAAADTGAMFPLQVITVGPSSVADITFTNIPNTYSHLQIRAIGRASTAGGRFRLRFNSDTGNNYTYHFLDGNGSSARSLGGGNFDKITLSTTPDPADLSNTFCAMIVDILDYANTNKYKTVRTLSGLDLNGSGELGLYSGLWQNTNAISTIRFFNDVGNMPQYTQVALYGVKSA